MTCELLKQKLTELRSSKHYLYALMEGLNKDEFYFCLYAREEAGKDKIKYTLKDFLTQYETFAPNEPVSINFLVLREDVNGTNYLSEWALFCESKHRISDFATGNLKDLFDDFLHYYCEKWMRNNKPFDLTPETIRHFGFTDEDVSELQPRIDNYNQQTDDRLWSEYENLMRMDCVRKRVEANAKSVKKLNLKMTRSHTIRRSMQGGKASPSIGAPYYEDISGTVVALKSGNDRFEDIIQSFFKLVNPTVPF